MILKKVLNHSREDIFKLLIESVLFDANQYSETKLSDIKEGFSYIKVLKHNKQDVRVKITIEKLIDLQVYKASFLTYKNTNYIEYKLEKIDENSTLLSVEETFKSSDIFNSMNYTIVSILLYFRNKRNLKYRFLQLEKSLERVKSKEND